MIHCRSYEVIKAMVYLKKSCLGKGLRPHHWIMGIDVVAANFAQSVTVARSDIPPPNLIQRLRLKLFGPPDNFKGLRFAGLPVKILRDRRNNGSTCYLAFGRFCYKISDDLRFDIDDSIVSNLYLYV